MEFLLDSVNLDDIKEALAHFPIAGVTSNPSIVKKSHPKNFWEHMKEVRRLIGSERTLHVQATGHTTDEICREAEEIVKHLGKETYIKVPVSYEGLPAIEKLKKEGYNITATAIYDPMQAYLAYCAGADYMAPYYNRISAAGGEPDILIKEVSDRIRMENSDCKILAASFKSAGQLRRAVADGTQAVTAPLEILKQVFANPSISKAVDDFEKDWQSVYGEKTLQDQDITAKEA